MKRLETKWSSLFNYGTFLQILPTGQKDLSMTKNVFATFASSDFSEALKRIEEQAHKMLIFDQVIAVDETVLAPAFRKEFFQK
ncbi:MAG: hypothetical protein ACI8TF_003126, partial [Paracoccaceae bacterium]